MKVVFVIPVFNECKTVETLAEGIARHVQGIDHRILFVDDGSSDGSSEILSRLCERSDRIGFIKLKRNYGKSHALAAGFSRAEGDIVVMMDADLQDDPEEIPRMLAKLDEGYDLVCGWKQIRNDPWRKTIPSKIYNWAVSRAFGLSLHDINTGFKAMRMETAKRLPLVGDMHRMIAVFAAGMGYRVTEIPVVHHPRRFGRSKYGFSRFYGGAADASAVWLMRGDAKRYGQWLDRIKMVFGAFCLVAAAGAIAAALSRHPLIALGCALVAAGCAGIMVCNQSILSRLRRRPLSAADIDASIESAIIR